MNYFGMLEKLQTEIDQANVSANSLTEKLAEISQKDTELSQVILKLKDEIKLAYNLDHIRKELEPIALRVFPNNATLQQAFMTSSIAGYSVTKDTETTSLRMKLATTEMELTALRQEEIDTKDTLTKTNRSLERMKKRLPELLSNAKNSLELLRKNYENANQESTPEQSAQEQITSGICEPVNTEASPAQCQSPS